MARKMETEETPDSMAGVGRVGFGWIWLDWVGLNWTMGRQGRKEGLECGWNDAMSPCMASRGGFTRQAVNVAGFEALTKVRPVRLPVRRRQASRQEFVGLN